MKRSVGATLVVIAGGVAVAGALLARAPVELPTVGGVPAATIIWNVAVIAAVIGGGYGLYALAWSVIERAARDKRRAHDARNLLRLSLLIGAIVIILSVVTEQWLGLLFSLGIVAFALTFALQQPLFSLIGWVYIMVKRPYQVGDRVKIGEAKGDVIEVDFLVTTLWEIDGDLVASNQPSGRLVTLPNSTVLSSQVYNFSWEEFPYVWNEISVQLAYETDIAFATDTMAEVADELLGDEMAARIREYRALLDETPVELEVRDRPTVNVTQRETWVELRVRYLVHPKRGQRVKNRLYERILERFNETPDRVAFPVGRSR